MPTVATANTDAWAIMIGEKAADLVLGRRLPAEEGAQARSLHPAQRGCAPAPASKASPR